MSEEPWDEIGFYNQYFFEHPPDLSMLAQQLVDGLWDQDADDYAQLLCYAKRLEMKLAAEEGSDG
jgi:hypothetical protein